MFAKFDEEAHNSLRVYRVYKFIPCMSIVTLTFKINRVHSITVVNLSSQFDKQNREIRGIFKGKSREKTRQVRENWSQLEHKQVPKGTEPGVRRVSVSCWHVTPVENAPLKPPVIR